MVYVERWIFVLRNRHAVQSKMLQEQSAIVEVRAELIVLQANVEFLIDEIMEVLIESERLRGTRTRLEIKLDILQVIGILADGIQELSSAF